MIIGFMNPFASAYLQSDFFGRCIFLALFVTSVLCWAILAHKIWLLSKAKKLCRHFESFFCQHKKTPLEIELDISPDTIHPFFSIYQVLKQYTVEVLNKNRFFAKDQHVYLSKTDLNMIEAHIIGTISQQTKKLGKNLFILSTIKTLAPFLGLLGTVWGILVTFSGLQTHAISSANATVLSGLATALSTTVLGLLIAIPALIAHNYLKNAILELHQDMEYFSQLLLTTVELQYRKADVMPHETPTAQ